MDNMTHDEMRFYRRELINLFLHESALAEWLPNEWNANKLAWCKEYVREAEVDLYARAMRIYYPDNKD